MLDRDSYQTLLRAGEVALLSTIVVGAVLYLIARIWRLGRGSVLRCELASLACTGAILGCFALSAILPSACGLFGVVFLIGGLLVGVMLALALMGLFFPEGRDLVLWIVYLVGMAMVAALVRYLLQQILG